MAQNDRGGDYCLILSVDGGGIKGLIPVTILAHLEKALGIKLDRLFDMAAGSSTGALVVLQLNALALNGAEIQKNFMDQALLKGMFDKRFWSFLSLFSGSIYSGDSKRKTLTAMLGDKRFTDIQKPTLITAYDISNNTSVVFKSTGGSDTVVNPTVVDIADASTAAPTYFPPVKIGDSWMIDGGIAANNPDMCALSYALKLGFSLEKIKMLSLGTGFSCI
ncbi:MAG: patatin-like phospholipase family protein, partial [Francisellaceae bacterium]